MQTTTITKIPWGQFQPPEHESWRDLAACLRMDPEDVSFFPDAYDMPAISAAKKICAGCPVVEMCLEYAILTNEPDGIWGGHTTGERARIRRGRLAPLSKAS